jgi:LPXTG-motif cell wall-anchored protein
VTSSTPPPADTESDLLSPSPATGSGLGLLAALGLVALVGTVLRRRR